MACPGAACHNLADLPGVSGVGPGSPLWHGYLFATLSDQLRHPVQLAPSRRYSGNPSTLRGDRTQGSQQYSIRAMCVDWRAAPTSRKGGHLAARVRIRRTRAWETSRNHQKRN
ncbi:hypothetical protein GCM10027162_74480 [Streptomyces incanus]